jgi:hypothetical protein
MSAKFYYSLNGSDWILLTEVTTYVRDGHPMLALWGYPPESTVYIDDFQYNSPSGFNIWNDSFTGVTLDTEKWEEIYNITLQNNSFCKTPPPSSGDGFAKSKSSFTETCDFQCKTFTTISVDSVFAGAALYMSNSDGSDFYCIQTGILSHVNLHERFVNVYDYHMAPIVHIDLGIDDSSVWLRVVVTIEPLVDIPSVNILERADFDLLPETTANFTCTPAEWVAESEYECGEEV